jgi:hypothetical protein
MGSNLFFDGRDKSFGIRSYDNAEYLVPTENGLKSEGTVIAEVMMLGRERPVMAERIFNVILKVDFLNKRDPSKFPVYYLVGVYDYPEREGLVYVFDEETFLNSPLVARALLNRVTKEDLGLKSM